MSATFTAATKGLKNISGGGKVYKSNTVFGPTLASTKIASVAQTEARLTGLEANAARIAEGAGRGAFAGSMNLIKDLQTGKKVLKGTAGITGLYTFKNSKKR